jgi:hypothetical protein
MKPRSLVALRVTLVVLFVVFYTLSSARGAAESLNGMRTFLPFLLPIVFLVLFVVFFRRGRRGVRFNTEGISLLAEGRPSAALESFEKARPLLTSGQGALIDHNVAVAHLALWRLDEADRFLQSARKGGQLVGDFAALALPKLALISAIRGRAPPFGLARQGGSGAGGARGV